METTHLTLRDREELATASGLLTGICRVAQAASLGDLSQQGLLDGVRRAIAGIEGVLERDLAGREDGPKEE